MGGRSGMRYFFNIYDEMVSLDPEGAELPSLASAIDHATTGARSLICAEASDGHITWHHRIEIVDGDGNVLHVVRYDQAVEVRR